MKRVLLITDYFRPEPGGLEALFTGIAQGWQDGMVEVVVTAGESEYLTGAEERRKFDGEQEYRVHRVALPRGGFLPRYLSFLNLNGKNQARDVVGFESLLEDRIATFAPEHIICGHISRSARTVLKSLSSRNLPYSVFLNGNDYKNKLSLIHYNERRMVLGASNVFTLSRFLARGIRGLGVPEEKITVLPPGLVPRWTARARRKSKVPEPLKARIKNKVTLLGMGPLVPRKGLDLAIEAMAALPELRDRIHLVLVGSGPEYSYLEELIHIRRLQEQVTLTGFLNDEILGHLLQDVDIFIQPGAEREDDMEGLSAALMEAAWFGLPAIVGEIGGIDEMVKDGVSGFLVPVGNAVALAGKIKELAGSERLMVQLGRSARDIARNEYDMDRTCATIQMRL